MTPAPEPARRRPEELLAACVDPRAREVFSPLHGSPCLVLDLSRPALPRIDAATEERLGAWLAELPCPVLALRPEASLGWQRLVCRVDCVLEDEGDLARAAAGASRRPLAALALVGLLRAGSALPVEAALACEAATYAALLGGDEHGEWLRSRGPGRPAPAAAGEPVRLRRRGPVLELVLQRPERHNAFSTAMRDALCEALELAVADETVEVVRLCGAGPSFCSGGDLEEFGSVPDPPTALAVRATRHPARWMARLAGRLEVRVHGACIGAGVELPAFAGRVVAAPDARFALPELTMGLVPGAGGTVSLPRRIGRQRTARLALSGETLDAQRALEWGLVDAVEGR